MTRIVAQITLTKGEQYTLLDYYGMTEHQCEYVGRVEPRGSLVKQTSVFNDYYLFKWDNQLAIAGLDHAASGDEIKVFLRIQQWGNSLETIYPHGDKPYWKMR